MNRRSRCTLIIAVITLCLYPVLGWARMPDSGIAADLDRLIKSRGRRADLGVCVVSITYGDQIYAYNADRLLAPASNMKLLTTAAALDALGPCYSFPTTVYVDRLPRDGVVEGNLYIKGYGDPYLTAEEMWLLVQSVYHQGLRRIKGDIIADDTYFDQQRQGNGWRGNGHNHSWYEAEIGALSCNFNTVEINIGPGSAPGAPLTAWMTPDTSYIKLINQTRTLASRYGGLVVDMHPLSGQHKLVISGALAKYSDYRTYWRTIDDPPLYTATVFRDFLAREGVKLDGDVRVGVVPAKAEEYYTYRSKPLAFMIRWLNKMSNNFMAEQVLKSMGAELFNSPGTDVKGLRAVDYFLKKIGVNTSNLTLADGSGLSSLNRVTPRVITQVLSYMYKNPQAGPEYVASLSIMGMDGTTHRRLVNTEARGMIRAKTGTIAGVSSLSGYIPTLDGEMLAFSIILNNTSDIGRAHSLQDRICLELVNLSRPQNMLKAQR